jgi:hypothetical protein
LAAFVGWNNKEEFEFRTTIFTKNKKVETGSNLKKKKKVFKKSKDDVAPSFGRSMHFSRLWLQLTPASTDGSVVKLLARDLNFIVEKSLIKINLVII